MKESEALEIFQWYSSVESVNLIKDAEARAVVADELADVVIYCLSFSNQADIDLSTAVLDKLKRNADRFPIGHNPT